MPERYTPSKWIAALALVGLTWVWVFAFGRADNPAPGLLAVWPSLVALVLVFMLRSVQVGLLLGALSGLILLLHGNPLLAFVSLFEDHLLPSLASPWNVGVLVFTLLMGGFVAVIEQGGGLVGVLKRLIGHRGQVRRRLSFAAAGLGLLCFFDGLANAMLVGRVMRPLAQRVGVSREKLAYIVDSTSAPIACMAFISTWIAFQVSLIQGVLDDRAMAGLNPYLLFAKSIPSNFYCLFTLALLLVVILFRWHIGPLRHAELEAERLAEPSSLAVITAKSAHWSRALLPVGILTGSFLGGMFMLGYEGGGLSLGGIAQAIGNAGNTGNQTVLVLVVACAVASIAAVLLNHHPGRRSAGEVYSEGMQKLFLPALILVSAWTLASVLKALGAADTISDMLAGNFPPGLLPVAVFLTGAVISFTTGTSWGTMGILMPICLPVAIDLAAPGGDAAQVDLMVLVVAAVFSGAVFGDHCSPMSDTTIVSSMACDVKPIDHVRAQLPYALIAAGVASVLGFLPAGYGVSVWLCLPVGLVVLVVLPLISRRALA